MKNIKFLLCSFLIFAFSLSVSANVDLHHKTKVELTKHQSPEIVMPVYSDFNEISMPVLNQKVPSIFVNVPQVPFKNSPVFGDVDKMDLFCRKSEYHVFYKTQHIFSNKKLKIHNVWPYQNKDYCSRNNSYFGNNKIYLCRLC